MSRALRVRTANLRAKIPDFRGFDSSIILMLRGGSIMSIWNFPGKVESRNLSRDSLSREIGRTSDGRRRRSRGETASRSPRSSCRD